MEEYFLCVNLRGRTFQLSEDIILKFPSNSPFMSTIKERYNININNNNLSCTKPVEQHQQMKPFYLNKNSDILNCILDSFETGELHFPQYMCVGLVQHELAYWGFRDGDMSYCCLDQILLAKENIKVAEEVSKQWEQIEKRANPVYDIEDEADKETNSVKENPQAWTTSPKQIRKNVLEPSKVCPVYTEKNKTLTNNDSAIPDIEQHSGNNKKMSRRHKIYMFLVDPTSSLPARIWSIFMIAIIIWSLLTIMLETETTLRNPKYEDVILLTNLTKGEGLYRFYFFNSYQYDWMLLVDFGITVILTAELTLRFMLTKKKLYFIRQVMTITDLLGTLPVWAIFMMYIYVRTGTNVDVSSGSHIFRAFIALSFFRLIRLMRFIHIMSKQRQLRLMGLAISRSLKEIMLLLLLLGMTSCVFGILMYWVEILQDGDAFLTVFHAQWWALVTMTTVGYGDMYPTKGGSYAIGVLCMIFGILIVAMTTTVLINSFLITYEMVLKNERINAFLKEKQEQENRKTRQNQSIEF